MADRQVEDVISPCIGVCTINESSGFCNGCYRTMDEIQDWWDMSAPQRSKVMSQLEGREENSVDFGD